METPPRHPLLAEVLAGACLLARTATAGTLLPPIYEGGVNLGPQGGRVSQGLTCWKGVVYVGVEAETCWPNQPQSSATVYAVDVGRPTQLQYLGRSSFGGCKAYGLAAFEDRLYVANWSDLLRTFDICGRSQIEPLGVFSVPGDFGWALSVQGDRVYLREAHELAESFYILDVANPASPRLVSATDWAGSPAVAGPYAYYRDGTWFNVLNISDETAPTPLGGVDLGVRLGDPQLRGDFAYAAWTLGSFGSGTSGLVCVDISDPTAPREVGRWTTPDFYFWGGLHLQGELAFLPTSGNGIFAVNLAQPTRLFSVAQFEVPYYALEQCVTGNGRHVYAGTVEGDRTGGVHAWQVFTQDPDDAPPGRWKNFSPRQTSWDLQYDGEALPTAARPAWTLFEGSAAWASVSNGVLRVNDTGTVAGDKVKWARRWPATSSRGATVMVRARCASHDTGGAFIPNLILEDGRHVEEFALLSDRIRARHAGLDYALDGTQWHVYRITTLGAQFKVYLDEAVAPVLAGTLAAPTPHARILFGSGSSPARQDIFFDLVQAFSGGARGPDDTTHDATPDVRVEVADIAGQGSLSGLATNTARVHWSTDAGTTWQSSGGVQWNGRYEADALPAVAAPAWHPVEGSNSLASASQGVLRILDSSTASNSKLKYERLWKASPATGATIVARVRCLRAGGDTTYTGNLFVEDGIHGESFKILPDRLVAREAGLTHFLDATSFHIYRITLKGAQFRVYVDEQASPVLSGPLTAPTSQNRVMFGSGASAGTQEIEFDYVRYCTTADLPPGEGDAGGPVAVQVTLPACADRGADRCTLSAQGIPFHRYSETLNRLRFSIQDLEGNVGWSPLYTLRIVLNDTDGDGLDDDWERTWFGGLGQDATTDFDADGAENRDEFHAGTNPRDPASRLQILAMRLLVPEAVEIRWTAVPGKTYRMQAASSPGGPGWTNVPSGCLTASSNVVVWNGPRPAARQQFYRVQVEY